MTVQKKTMDKLKLRDRFKVAASVLRRGMYTMPVKDYVDAFSIGAMTAAGVSVNATNSQKFSAVFACVRTYEWVMASLPMRITSNNEGKLEEIKTGDIYDLLHWPNKYLNAFTFIGLMNARLQLYGNAVAVIIFNKRGVPVELIPVEWSSVNIKLYKGQPFYFINDKDTGIYTGNDNPFFHWQVIHFKINSRNGWTGMSPISVARESIGLGMAAENFGSDFFSKGGNLKGVLETDQNIPDRAFNEWLKRWNKNYEGNKGNHKTPVLEYGMKYKALGIPPNDAQFIETRVHQIQDVARFFGMSASIIGENSNNAFTSAEQQDIQFVKYALLPLCKSQEAELEFKLMDRNNQERLDIKYNQDMLLRGDMLSRARYEQTLVASGIITRNEARELEGKGSLDGLDTPLDPAFLTGKLDTTSKAEDDGKA